MSTSSTSATSSICGFGVGSENCYIAIARAGGIEIILNDYSQRSTPAYIGFGQNQRELGVSAKQKQMMNLSNTCYSPNRLIGRQMKEMSEEYPFMIEANSAGEMCVRVWHNGEETTFTATQIMAMLFTKLRQLNGNSVDCVINCPVYFTDAEKRSMIDAALIAGLDPIRIISDMTAISLYYGFYRSVSAQQDVFIVGFVDVGNTTTQCSIVLFNNKEHYIRILSVEYDALLGGKHFDEIIANYFIEQQKLKLNKRSRFRLIAECEKLKKQMSANSNELPINVECLYDEKDFSGKMDRVLFEELTQPLLSRINDVFERALQSAVEKYTSEFASKLGDFKIDTVEIVGGASRMPAIKRLVKSVFGVDCTTTLNADEAVARGCALQCAMLSPTFKVAREIQVIDYAPYQINFKYWHQSIKECEVKSVNALFPRGHQMPFTKQLTVNCQSLPIIAAFEYVNDSNQIIPIGEFKISSLQEMQSLKNQVKLRVRLDPNGLIVIQSASLIVETNSSPKKGNDSQVEDMEVPNNEQNSQPMDTEEQQNAPNEQNDIAKDGDQQQQQNNKEEKEKEKTKNKKQKPTSIELQIEPLWLKGKLTEAELNTYKEIEMNLILTDKNFKEKTDAKNSLEEYIYEWKDKLEDGGYDPFIENAAKNSFMNTLKTAEQWLYEQEENGHLHSKSVYEEKLKKMQEMFSNDVLFRKREFETRPSLLEQLGQRLQQGMKVLGSAEEVESENMKKLENELSAKQKWCDEAYAMFQSMKTFESPSITCDHIRQQSESIATLVRQISNDRRRREEEAKRKAETEKAEREKAANKPSPPPQTNTGDQQNEANANDPSMDVDSTPAPSI